VNTLLPTTIQDIETSASIATSILQRNSVQD
jgi:hypothetical protein